MKLNLALYKRAILTDSRKFALYGAWLVMGGFLFIELYGYVGINSALSFRGRNINGLGFLKFIAYTNFVFIILAGVLGFSSSITEEKEEDCLGLLIMTGISPLNLLASKMLARYTRGLFLLLSQMPFIILAVTLGGVSIQQVIAVYSVLISFMFMLCCLGTLVSLLFSKTSWAASVTFLLLIAYIAFVVILGESRIIHWSDMEYFLPFVAISKVFTTGYSDYIMPIQFFSSITLGLLFFALSVFLFEKCALRKPSEKKKKNKTNILKRGRAWHNALFWKEFNFNLSGRRGWIFQFIIYLVLLIVIIIYVKPYSGENFLAGFMAFTAMVFSSLILAVCASNMFSSEFKEGTHTSLFTLPEELSSIFWSKVFGSILYTLPSILLSITLFLYLLSETFRGPDIELVFVFLSFILVYIILSGYLGLLMRIGSFVASAAILLISWIIIGWLGLSRMGPDEAALTMIVINLIGSTFAFILARNKLLSMISR